MEMFSKTSHLFQLTHESSMKSTNNHCLYILPLSTQIMLGSNKFLERVLESMNYKTTVPIYTKLHMYYLFRKS